jgi:UDP:flavonoid glycosyltransferase YjiC (YdhE family)
MAALNPHFLVICFGTTGDVHPFMHIANTLQAMGRRVNFVVPHVSRGFEGQQGHQADGIEEKI